jgi:hypothetical protein
MITQP